VGNNQLAAPMASPPPWLAGLLTLPGFKGEAAGKGDGVIADPATELGQVRRWRRHRDRT
jgi:filamentous hemagglutinin